jgi:hypothetical protein
METFNSDGSYNKTDWENGDIITADKLNKIEDAIYEINADNDNFVTTSDFGAALSRKANTNHTHSDYATKTYVDNAVANGSSNNNPNINLSEYVTEDELNQSLESYATKTYVDDTIANANLPEYATKQYVDDAINNAMEVTYTGVEIRIVTEYPADEDPNVLYIKVRD